MRHFVSVCLVCHTSWENILKFVFENSRFQIYSRGVSISPRAISDRPLCHGCKQIAYVLGNDCDHIRLYFFEINKKRATGKSAMCMLLHWYCHRGFGCGKIITFILKIFGNVYTRDGTISLCQRDANAQVVMSHNHSTHVLDPFIPSLYGHQMTWSSQISVKTSCALSNEP